MVTELNKNPGDYVYLIYANRFRSTKDRERVFDLYTQIFDRQPYRQENQAIQFTKTHLQIGQSFLFFNSKDSENSFDDFANNKLSSNYSLTYKNSKYLESIIKCIEMNWLTILVGHSCVGKTSLIRLIASLSNRKLVEFSVNNSTDTSDLLGGYEKIKHLKQDLDHVNQRIKHFYLKHMKFNQISHLKVYLSFLFENKNLLKKMDRFTKSGEETTNNDDDSTIITFIEFYEANLKKLLQFQSISKSKIDKSEIESLIKKCEEIRSLKSSSTHGIKAGSKMKFEWIDSSLVKAIEQGDWVLIDNANFCPPSVLDRLNPLLERNGGVLQINEKGIQENGKLYEIKAHKDFRLILTMNETFGELSRPMRNRGIELYMNEYDLDSDMEDVFIILSTLYPFNFNSNDLCLLFTKSLESVHIKQNLHFSDVLKMFKLTYDYWLLNFESSQSQNGILGSFVKMLDDLKLSAPNLGVNVKLENNMHKIAQISQRNFYSDILKLKEFKIYKFLFNFPLYSQFMQSFSQLLSSDFGVEGLNLDNYALKYLDIVKKSQFIDIWLKNIPLGYYNLIVKFTQNNLLPKNSQFRQRKSQFFDLLANDLFNENQDKNGLFSSLKQTIHDLCKFTSLDLNEQTIDFKSNEYLCLKFDKNNIQVENLMKYTQLFQLIIRFYLSKFRIESFYSNSDSSLVSIIEKIDSNLVIQQQTNANNLNNQVNLKFLDQLKPFYQTFFQSLLNYSCNNIKQFEAFDQNVLMNTIYLIEKFYLICSACSYDNFLTLSYMKYYWSFIENGLKKIENLLPK
jgi:MoxR-like ATPase